MGQGRSINLIGYLIQEAYPISVCKGMHLSTPKFYYNWNWFHTSNCHGKRGTYVHKWTNSYTLTLRCLTCAQYTNCLLSATCFDDAGGKFERENGKCLLKDETNNIIAEGIRVGRLYLLNGRALLLGQERTNYVATPKLSWDQWHWCFGHINIGIKALRLGKYGWWSIHRSVFDHIEILWCMYPSKTSTEKLPTGCWTLISDIWRTRWYLGTSRKEIHWQMEILYSFHRWLHLLCACTIFKGQGSSFWLHQRMCHTN